MKTIRIATGTLIPPIIAALAMTKVLFGPVSDAWNLGNKMLFHFIGGPLTIASPFISGIGILCCLYARRHSTEKSAAYFLLMLNTLLLLIGTSAAIQLWYHGPIHWPVTRH